MKLYIKFLVALMFLTGALYAQNETDALRYSQLNYSGTARYNGAGGAFGALGADISVTNTNPAGLAQFSNAQFVFTPALPVHLSSATYNGTTANESRVSFNFNNIGFVTSKRLASSEYSKWSSFQFAIVYNRINDFQRNHLIKGEHTNSLLDEMADYAFNIPAENLASELPFSSSLAYEAFLIDLDSLTGIYNTFIPRGNVNQTKNISQRGRMGETSFAISGSWDDQIFVGASIGIPGVKFREKTSHREDVLDETLSLTDFTYTSSLTTRGWGINAKIGVIVIPTDFLRLGLALHTPSQFFLQDQWSNTITSNFYDGFSATQNSPNQSFDYQLKTPGRMIGSAAVIIGKIGFISADYEYVNHTKAKLSSSFENNADYSIENSNINNKFRSASNIRLGGELNLSPLKIRAGARYSQNPIKDEFVSVTGDRMSYSAGVGFTGKGAFIDLAYSLTKWKSEHYLYSPDYVSPAAINNSLGVISITVGLKDF